MFHRTERLLLRPGWLEDATEVTTRIADEAIVRNLARAPWPYHEDNAREWLAAPRHPRLPNFLVTLPAAGGARIIGSCGMHEENGEIEIGYWIARDWWGQGFATEAARALLSIARTLGYGRIGACHAVDNPGSGRVLRKVGFKPTGHLRQMHSLGRGTSVAAAEFSIHLDGSAGDDGPTMMPQAA